MPTVVAKVVEDFFQVHVHESSPCRVCRWGVVQWLGHIGGYIILPGTGVNRRGMQLIVCTSSCLNKQISHNGGFNGRLS